MAPGSAHFEDVLAFQEGELVAGDEVRLGDQVAGMDGLGSKAQVRDGHRAGLLGIVDEVALRVVGGLFADDFDGVLVGADRAIRAEAVEDGAHGAGLLGGEGGIVAQAGVGDIVVDADGEVVLGGRFEHLVEDALTMAGVNSLEERP